MYGLNTRLSSVGRWMKFGKIIYFIIIILKKSTYFLPDILN